MEVEELSTLGLWLQACLRAPLVLPGVCSLLAHGRAGALEDSWRKSYLSHIGAAGKDMGEEHPHPRVGAELAQAPIAPFPTDGQGLPLRVESTQLPNLPAFTMCWACGEGVACGDW